MSLNILSKITTNLRYKRHIKYQLVAHFRHAKRGRGLFYQKMLTVTSHENSNTGRIRKGQNVQ